MKKRKIYVIGPAKGYASWILPLGFEHTNNPNEADVALLTGGEDIHPSLYGEAVGSRTYFTKERDNFELKLYRFFAEKNTPIVGTCRGGQLLTVLAGGKLVQDTSHPGRHNVTTWDEKVIQINSLHHQQFLVDEELTGLKEGVDYHMLMWAECLSPYHYNGDDIDLNLVGRRNYREPELVHYPLINAFAIQCHPEMMASDSVAVKYFQNMFIEFMDLKTPSWQTSHSHTLKQ